MKRRILLIGYNYYPEPTGIGKYSGEMVAWLAQSGYECEVLTSYPYYPQWRVHSLYSDKRRWYYTDYHDVGKYKIKVNRCPMYVPSVPTGFKRVLLDLSFFVSAFFKLFLLLFNKKFDYVITVVPCFKLGLLGIFYKFFHKAILLYHIQDMQIEAARDLKLIRSQIALSFLFKLESFILRKSDIISTISEGMVRKTKSKVEKDIYLFTNWTDCKFFFPIQNRLSLKKQFGFSPTDKIILYSGAIGEKQGLEAILEAAKSLGHHHSLKFVICGSGPYKEKLSLLAERQGLRNVLFFPLQPSEDFNNFLNVADVHLVLQKANASDLVMPSKLTSILGAGGLAVITANKDTALHSCVTQHNIGLVVEPENQEALNKAICKAVTENYEDIRKNARFYAEEHLSIEMIMGAFEQQVLNKNSESKPLHVTAEEKCIVESQLSSTDYTF